MIPIEDRLIMYQTMLFERLADNYWDGLCNQIRNIWFENAAMVDGKPLIIYYPELMKFCPERYSKQPCRHYWIRGGDNDTRIAWLIDAIESAQKKLSELKE